MARTRFLISSFSAFSFLATLSAFTLGSNCKPNVSALFVTFVSFVAITTSASAAALAALAASSALIALATANLATLTASSPLAAPTARPDEPITAGMDFGGGPGSEALALQNQRTLSQILASMIDIDPTGDVQELYNYVASRGL